jgi:hypothetical protein
MTKPRVAKSVAELTYNLSLVPLYREKWLNSLPGGSIYEANRDILDQHGLAELTAGAHKRYIEKCALAGVNPQPL